jgi:hypothetical protein
LGVTRLVAMALLATPAGCGGGGTESRTPPVALPLLVLADSGRSTTLRVNPAATAVPRDVQPVRAWLVEVSASRPAAPAVGMPPPDSVRIALDPPAGLALDDGLRPPIPRGRTAVVLPDGRGARRAVVELDVRVDERGDVSDAMWAGGSEDSALVAAAEASALAMRFHPALQSGRPVAVWCRQRFEFGGTRIASPAFRDSAAP